MVVGLSSSGDEGAAAAVRVQVGGALGEGTVVSRASEEVVGGVLRPTEEGTLLEEGDLVGGVPGRGESGVIIVGGVP